MRTSLINFPAGQSPCSLACPAAKAERLLSKSSASSLERRGRGAARKAMLHISAFAAVLLLATAHAFTFKALRRGLARGGRGLCLGGGKGSAQDWDRPDYVPAPNRVGGNGEWEDWVGAGDDAFIGEDVDYGQEEQATLPAAPTPSAAVAETAKEDDKRSVTSFADWRSDRGRGGGDFRGDFSSSRDDSGWGNLLKSTNGGGIGKSASENWEGWSEEPPFFEDEPEEREPIASLGSSDLWSRSTANDVGVAADVQQAVLPPPLQPSTQQPYLPPTGSSPLVPPASSTFSVLELRLETLNREVSNLKALLGLLVGLFAGIQIGDKSIF